MSYLKKQLSERCYVHLRFAGYLLIYPIVSVEVVNLLVRWTLEVDLQPKMKMGLCLMGLMHGLVMGSYVRLSSNTRVWCYRVSFFISVVLLGILLQ
ncbi:hypothetical protein D3C80_356500 [compost metagenome]